MLVVVASLGMGFVAGSSYGSRKTPSAGTSGQAALEGKPTQPAGVCSITTNKVIKHIAENAAGKVKSLSGKTLVLEEAGDTLEVEVAPNARIFRVTLPSPNAAPEAAVPQREEWSLEKIKVGDQVEALLASQPDGSFLASEVTVFVEGE